MLAHGGAPEPGARARGELLALLQTGADIIRIGFIRQFPRHHLDGIVNLRGFTEQAKPH